MLSLETHLGATASPQAPFPTDYVTLPVSAGHRRFGSLPLAAEEGYAPVLQCQLHRVLHSKHAQAASPPSGRATLAGRTVGHIPAPNLARRRGDVRGPRPDDLGGLGSTAVLGLAVFTQHASKARLAGNLHTFVGQHGHDARWRHFGEARLVGYTQQRCALGWAQGMGRRRTHCVRPAIARCETFASLGVCVLSVKFLKRLAVRLGGQEASSRSVVS